MEQELFSCCQKSQPSLSEQPSLFTSLTMITNCCCSSLALRGSGSSLRSFPAKSLPISSSASLMLCSLSALPAAPSSGSSVPWPEHTSHRRHPRPSLQHQIWAMARPSVVSRPLASVHTEACAMWHAETITVPSPCVLLSPEQQWQVPVCLSSLTAMTVAISIHCPSVKVPQSDSQCFPACSLGKAQQNGQ